MAKTAKKNLKHKKKHKKSPVILKKTVELAQESVDSEKQIKILPSKIPKHCAFSKSKFQKCEIKCVLILRGGIANPNEAFRYAEAKCAQANSDDVVFPLRIEPRSSP